MAGAFKAMAEKQPDAAEAHLREALHHVDLALEVYDPSTWAYRFGEATRLRDGIVGKLAALGEGE